MSKEAEPRVTWQVVKHEGKWFWGYGSCFYRAKSKAWAVAEVERRNRAEAENEIARAERAADRLAVVKAYLASRAARPVSVQLSLF